MGFSIRKNILLDMILLINSIVSNLPIPILIFFLLDTALNDNDISFVFSLKFWGVALFSAFIIPISNYFSVKRIIIISILIKLIAYFTFFAYQNFYGAILLVGLNTLSSSLFSTASKLYIQEISNDISRSLSRRFTVNNIGVAASPVLLLIFNNLSYLLAILLFLMIILFFLSFLLDDVVTFKKDNNKCVKIDSKLLLFLFFACFLFSILYLAYEKEIPIVLDRKNDKEIYSAIVLLNTTLIIFFQIKTYAFFTKFMGVYKAISLAYLVSVISYIPFWIFRDDYIFMFIFVIGLTYLEMFFSTAVDYIIIKRGGVDSKYYFVIFNIFIAIGITLSFYVFPMNEYMILIILSLLISLFVLILKINSKTSVD